MSLTTHSLIGVALLVVGLLLGRWAAAYDVKSWFTDAIWRIVFSGRWRELHKKRLDELPDHDPTLKQQLSDKIRDVRADTARIGTVRTVAKHGGMFAFAYAVSWLAGFLQIAAVLVLAYAAWRWWM